MIAIIDYKMGNLSSVYKAFKYLGYDCVITDDEDVINKADKIVLPGVGAFRDAINVLKEKKLDLIIKNNIKSNKPFLGICLGMQLLFTTSYEDGEYKGLDVIKGDIIKFDTKLKIPHVGFNNINILDGKKLFKGINNNPNVYFVHSYHVKCDMKYASSLTNYDYDFISSIEYNNIFLVQFHPEKSGEIGLKILKNFAEV